MLVNATLASLSTSSEAGFARFLRRSQFGTINCWEPPLTRTANLPCTAERIADHIEGRERSRHQSPSCEFHHGDSPLQFPRYGIQYPTKLRMDMTTQSCPIECLIQSHLARSPPWRCPITWPTACGSVPKLALILTRVHPPSSDRNQCT